MEHDRQRLQDRLLPRLGLAERLLGLGLLGLDPRVLVEVVGQSPGTSWIWEQRAQVMADSDLAIGAAGSTSWERCCLGLPTLLVVLAENQLEGARALDHAGAARLLGAPEAILHELASILPMLLRGQPLADMCCAARAVADGQGTVRVLQQIECFA